MRLGLSGEISVAFSLLKEEGRYYRPQSQRPPRDAGVPPTGRSAFSPGILAECSLSRPSQGESLRDTNFQANTTQLLYETSPRQSSCRRHRTLQAFVGETSLLLGSGQLPGAQFHQSIVKDLWESQLGSAFSGCRWRYIVAPVWEIQKLGLTIVGDKSEPPKRINRIGYLKSSNFQFPEASISKNCCYRT